MSTASDLPANSALCDGISIEYRAFLRKMNPDLDAGVIVLIASCIFGNPAMTLFFDGYRLMQTPPTGIHPQYDTFYVASVTSKLELANPPDTVTVTDGFGSHDVPVTDWMRVPKNGFSSSSVK